MARLFLTLITLSTKPTTTSSFGTWDIDGAKHDDLSLIDTTIGISTNYEMTPGSGSTSYIPKKGQSGDVFVATNYRVGMLPMADKMRVATPKTLQPWFDENSASKGIARHSAACLNYLIGHGPRYGYFPSPSKSWYTCKEADEPLSLEAF